MGQPSGQGGDAHEPLPVGGADPQPGDALGPYVIDSFLASGGMASVFRARDTRSGAEVALKLLRPMADDPSSRTRFRREFRALQRLDHPNVLRVYEWGLLGTRPWFSMELVPGSDLGATERSWAELGASERMARAQASLIQLTRALDYIHDRGLVHRDLTPANVIIRPDGTVKLMDFGVVREVGSELTSTHQVMGTAAWIAPEQILGEHIDARADLYSLGALLYLMLTGKRPFTARTVQGWLDKHLHEVPRSPREIDPRVPEHLDSICVRLLAKNPQDRFASASHLLHVLGDQDPLDDDEHWPPRLVGRTLLRARVRRAVASVSDGKPGGVLLIQGVPGQGKTRLLDLAESKARRRGLKVARAASQQSDPPFGTFIKIVQDLEPELVPEPVQAALFGNGERPRERYPVLSAFKTMLSKSAPAVIIIDDLHLADGASLDLLEYLVRNTLELAEEPMLFVLGEEATQAEATPLEQRLSSVPSLVRDRLGPLALSEVEELVLSLVHDPATADALAARLHAESEGSPSYLVDMLRGLVDEGLLVQEGRRWNLMLAPEEITRSRLPMPASLRQALQERLNPLSAEAVAVGRTLAIARRRLSLDVLLQMSSFDEDLAVEAIDDLVEAGIAHESRQEGIETLELSHQRFREVLLEGLTPARRRKAHQRLGELLERHNRDRPGRVAEELTYHFDEAQIPTKAYAYLRQTAALRLDASLWDEALSLLDRAIQIEPAARPHLLLDDADRALAEVRLGRSKGLLALGQAELAEADARTSAQLARDVADPELESKVLVEVGRQLRSRGDTAGARPVITEALERARAAHDPALLTSPLYELGALCWGEGELELAESHWRASLETAQRVGDQRAIGYGYNGLGILAVCTGQTMEARRHLEQCAAMFERIGMLAPLSIARTNLAELYRSTGLLKKALAIAERTILQAREVHHPLGVALGLTHRSRVLAEIGRVEEARRDAEEAVRLTVELRSEEDELPARAFLGLFHATHGAPELAIQVLSESAERLHDFDTEGIEPQIQAARAIALASLGRDADAWDALDKTNTQRVWPHIQVQTDLARAQALSLLDAGNQAEVHYQTALQLAESSGYRLYQLKAHHGLAQLVTDESTQARHARVAGALARSLSASLATDDSVLFLGRGWGQRAE
ncbi:MAG: protein kinase [Myxococcota bacterium]